MSNLRERLNGALNGNDEVFEDKSKFSGAKVGANQKRACVRFVPLPGNAAFADGEGVDLPYAHHCKTRFKRDYSEVTVFFTADKVTITGRNLKSLCDGIRDHLCELVEQSSVDPLQAAARARQGAAEEAVRMEVTGLTLESIE